MLDMGFINDIKKVGNNYSKTKTKFTFSTFSNEIKKLADGFTKFSF